MPFKTKTRQEQLAKEERAKTKLAKTAYILTVNKQLTKKNINKFPSERRPFIVTKHPCLRKLGVWKTLRIWPPEGEKLLFRELKIL